MNDVQNIESPAGLVEAPQPPCAGVVLAAPDSVPSSKRTLDLVLIFLALPLILPLMVFIAALIRIVSRGPVLFRQERIGYRGNPFMIFKFRTMFVNADTTVHQAHLNQLMGMNIPMEKMDVKGDPRLIPFGRILRASGLDELPQIINVLLGDMSLVGPRPCLQYECEKYEPWQKERFHTLPGLTGLWQVSGKNRTTFREMMDLDIAYVRTHTRWLDLKIIFKTIPALIVQMRDTRKRKQASLSTIRPALPNPGRG